MSKGTDKRDLEIRKAFAENALSLLKGCDIPNYVIALELEVSYDCFNKYIHGVSTPTFFIFSFSEYFGVSPDKMIKTPLTKDTLLEIHQKSVLNNSHNEIIQKYNSLTGKYRESADRDILEKYQWMKDATAK